MGQLEKLYQLIEEENIKLEILDSLPDHIDGMYLKSESSYPIIVINKRIENDSMKFKIVLAEEQGPAALGPAQLRGQIVRRALGRLAIEGQGDVQGVQRPPARAGQAGLTPRQGLGDVLGDRNGGEQSQHATLGSGRNVCSEDGFSLQGGPSVPIFPVTVGLCRPLRRLLSR